MPRRPIVVAALVSFLLLLARFAFPVAALSDPTGTALPPGLHLAFPIVNIILAPLFDLWDGVTLLAMPRLNAFLVEAVAVIAAGSLLGSLKARRVQWLTATIRLGVGILGLGLFVLGGVAWRRPMAHLANVPSDRWVADLHSHTNVSHDVKGLLQRDFDINASRAWHRRGGFDLFFITDHNRVDGWMTSADGKLGIWATPGPDICPGEELSLWGAHIVVLGNLDSIPRGLYADSAPGITRLLLESGTRWQGLTLASIPEYDANHFADLPQWIASGVDGFEVSNAAPKANQQTLAHRDSVIALAHGAGRWIAGVSDQHGLGATVQAWTLIPRITAVPHDREMPLSCQEALAALTTLGVRATEVIERHRLRLDAAWPIWATVIAVPWEGWRAAGMAQSVSWLAWIWGIAALAMLRRKRGE